MPDKETQMDEPDTATAAPPPDSDAAAELSETKDRLLRVLADQENVRSQARRGI